MLYCVPGSGDGSGEGTGGSSSPPPGAEGGPAAQSGALTPEEVSELGEKGNEVWERGRERRDFVASAVAVIGSRIRTRFRSGHSKK